MGTPTPHSAGDFEPFRVIEPLGKGGSGAVFRAQRGGAIVALKVLRPDLAITEKECQRFLDEAQRLSTLDHPNIVQVRDCGRLANGRPYLAMELIEGEDLAAYQRRIRPTQLQSLSLFAQLSEAVHCLHEAGLVHRDLKPENVMLDHGGKKLVLLDLGIAKEADASPSTTTQAGLQRGTPMYMAPERFFGARATVSSDLYELGVILYQLLCGTLPWSQLLDPNERMNPRRPSELGVGLGAPLEAVLMRALSSSPETRPRSAREFRLEVEAALGSSDTVAVRSAGDSMAFGQTQARTPDLALAQTIASDQLPDMGRMAKGTAREQSSDRLEGPTTEVTPPPTATGSRIWMWTSLALAAALISVVAYLAGRSDSSQGEPAAGATPAPADGAVVAAQLPIDAAAPVAMDAAPPILAVADADAAPPKPIAKRKRKSPTTTVEERAPLPRSKVTAPTSRNAKGPEPSADLYYCRQYKTLYCNEEFKATEFGSSGALCESMKTLVGNFEKAPPQGRIGLDRSCQRQLPGMRAAAKQRIREFRERGGPPVLRRTLHQDASVPSQ